ncbi:hypothetical protein OUY22_00490 [Nonomuraea sp. MCN248]|uniref:Uncharacterized protein n=1 Tax=Nonomuraea corallina TaxID=2989783 RepID=A0ABT4S499_9ACTN|nr:hypothetical protein [Nonomuraea corallina]MDA0631878.1 hypothetical protein [Nonomuraea corallina]
MTENLLYDTDVHTLLDEERRGGVPGVVDPDVPDAGLLEDGLPAAIDQVREPAWARRVIREARA